MVKHIMPTMFRALVSIYEDELEYNNKILETGIVPPTECISGNEDNPIYGSVWSLNHDYVLNDIGEDSESLHAILKKKITIKCINGELEITDLGCYILHEELEGVYIVCTEPIKFDSAYINENVKPRFKGRWH